MARYDWERWPAQVADSKESVGIARGDKHFCAIEIADLRVYTAILLEPLTIYWNV